MILQVLIVMLASWINRQQEHAIIYLCEENRLLRAKRKGRRLNLTDTERRRLAVLAHPIGRKRLKAVASIATPDTLQRWYRHLVVQEPSRMIARKQPGRPRVPEEIEHLVVRMVNENRTWGYRRIQGALANLGYPIDSGTVRHILRRHHIDPAPTRRQGGMSWVQFFKLHWDVLQATDFFAAQGAHLWTSMRSCSGARATRVVQLAGLMRHGAMRMVARGIWQVHSFWAGWLLGRRVRLAVDETRDSMPRGYESSGQLCVVHQASRQPAPCQHVKCRGEQERSPPGERRPGLRIATGRHPWGTSVSESRLVCGSGVGDDSIQEPSHGRREASLTCSYQAAA